MDRALEDYKIAVTRSVHDIFDDLYYMFPWRQSVFVKMREFAMERLQEERLPYPKDLFNTLTSGYVSFQDISDDFNSFKKGSPATERLCRVMEIEYRPPIRTAKDEYSQALADYSRHRQYDDRRNFRQQRYTPYQRPPRPKREEMQSMHRTSADNSYDIQEVNAGEGHGGEAYASEAVEAEHKDSPV